MKRAVSGKDSAEGRDEGLSLQDVLDDAELRMMGAVEALEDKLRSIRTGRASPSLLERIKVQCYGTESPIRQVAALAAPEPRLLMVRPYDPHVIADIEKAIVASGLGLNPQNDGKVIRIPIPPLTDERRHALTKVAQKEAEGARVAVRNVRRDGNRELDRIKKEGLAGEDDCYRAKDRVQELTDKYEKEIEKALEAKTKDILEG